MLHTIIFIAQLFLFSLPNNILFTYYAAVLVFSLSIACMGLQNLLPINAFTSYLPLVRQAQEVETLKHSSFLQFYCTPRLRFTMGKLNIFIQFNLISCLYSHINAIIQKCMTRIFNTLCVREDAHKKTCFFSDRTTKRGYPDHRCPTTITKQKTPFYLCLP